MRITRRELLANHARLTARNELYQRYGYDMERDLHSVLLAALPLPGRLLEIGTGQGRFLAALLERVPRVTTVDIDSTGQRMARLNIEWTRQAAGRSLGQVRYVVADATRLPWPDRTFDSLVSVNTLHHMTDIPAVLREIVRVVRPGGRVVLADFNSRGFAILQRVHRAEGRDHERIKYRFPDLVRQFAEPGWNTAVEHTDCITVLIARRPAEAGRRQTRKELT